MDIEKNISKEYLILNKSYLEFEEELANFISNNQSGDYQEELENMSQVIAQMIK